MNTENNIKLLKDKDISLISEKLECCNCAIEDIISTIKQEVYEIECLKDRLRKIAEKNLSTS